MGNIAPTNKQVGVVLTKSLVEKIDERRVSLSMTRGKFIALVLENWESAGCPPVNKADRALLVLEGKHPSPKPAKPAK